MTGKDGMGRKIRAFCLLAALPLALATSRPAVPRPQEVGLTQAQKDAVVWRIAAEVAKQRIPGIGYAVVAEGKIILTGGAGYENWETKEPATDETVWRLSSISKTFTAAAALRLAEQGKLNLDAPVQQYVGPLFPPKQWQVTTRQLLGHQGGIRHYRGNEMFNTIHYKNVLDPLRIFNSDPLLFEPGTKYYYSTYGFCLAGAVVEKAAGRRFADVVRDTVFKPADMRDAGVDDPTRTPRHLAPGYVVASDGTVKLAPAFDSTSETPGSGFVCTAPDLARYAAAMMGDNRIVDNVTRQKMWTEGRTRNGKTTGYGLGWGITSYNGRRVIAHSGGQPGVSTLLWMVPGRRFAVVLLTNRDGAALSGLAKSITDVALR